MFQHTWTYHSASSRLCEGASVVAHDMFMFVIGGFNHDFIEDRNIIFHFREPDSFMVHGPRMPLGRAEAVAALV